MPSLPQEDTPHGQNYGSDAAAIVERVIKRRRSTRHFSGEKISTDILHRLVEAGIYAPSGSNFQNQRFLIVDDRQQIEALDAIRFVWPYRSPKEASDNNSNGILGNAAALILVFADSFENDRRGQGEYYLWEALEIQNCSASIENILLLSSAMGIGSCWVSATEPMNHTRLLGGKSWTEALSAFDVPSTFKIQGIILLGYPKKIADDGMPAGERRHGTVWSDTERKPIDHYLIKPRSDLEPNLYPKLNRFQLLRLTITSRLIRGLLFIVRQLDKSIHQLEIKKILPTRDDRSL